MIKRVFILVLDGSGVGALPDAGDYGDLGCNTLSHVALECGPLKIPNLLSLGLGRVVYLQGTSSLDTFIGAYGKMAESSPGKDTTTGHWELAGLVLQKPFPLFPEGFPRDLISGFEKAIGRKTLGNYAASGTEIIQVLGEEHLKTGSPIVYTSADSVFQVAAHEEVVPLKTLYEWCLLAREQIFTGDNAVARVIARPFRGTPGQFWRTKGRRDFSLPPFSNTLLDLAVEAGYEVWAVGKVKDVFAGKGITRHLPASDNKSIMKAVSQALREDFKGILWATLVDFDMLYGHRNDVKGFALALEEFDIFLGKIMLSLQKEDLLVITADHGCDPTHPGTDHTREYVPLLVFGDKVINGPLAIRESFADLGATVAELLNTRPTANGQSFAVELIGQERYLEITENQ